MVQKRSTTSRKVTKSAKAPVKRHTTAKKSSRKPAMQSFRVVKEPRNFMTVSFSEDTLHWIIIGAVILMFAFLIASMHIRIESLYDALNAV
ncbi:hypothetical protein KBD87_03305 [Candidatus Saccharibacteria bacterium]|nr:hypothetical protein [Candidatus Saccharibacteria bacterium]